MAKRIRSKPVEVFPLIESIKQAIAESGLSLNQLARESGIDASQLSRFIRGERQLSLEVASRLCTYLGLEVARTKRKAAAAR